MKKILIFTSCFAILLLTIFITDILNIIDPPQYTISIDMSPRVDHPDMYITCNAYTYYISSPSLIEFRSSYNKRLSDPAFKPTQLNRTLAATNELNELRRDFHVKEGMFLIARSSDYKPLGLIAEMFIQNKKLFINLRFHEKDIKVSYLPAKDLGITSFSQWADFLEKNPDPQAEDIRKAANIYQGKEVVWRETQGTYCENISPGLYIFCIDRKRISCYDTVTFMLEFSQKN